MTKTYTSKTSKLLSEGQSFTSVLGSRCRYSVLQHLSNNDCPQSKTKLYRHKTNKIYKTVNNCIFILVKSSTPVSRQNNRFLWLCLSEQCLKRQCENKHSYATGRSSTEWTPSPQIQPSGKQKNTTSSKPWVNVLVPAGHLSKLWVGDKASRRGSQN